MRVFVLSLAIVAGLYLVVALFIALRQRDFVFVPSTGLAGTPDETGMEYEELYLEVNDSERIHAWYFPADSAKRTVLFCHGNAGNISRRLLSIEHLHSLGVNLLIFDYRGYGLSDGEPSEENCYEDAVTAYHWLTDVRGMSAEDIVIFGRSLGGGVAVELARRVDCAGVVVESSFTSTVDMGKKMFPFLPIDLLLRYRFESLEKISDLDCPVLITHSTEDDLIPVDMGRKLYEQAPHPKRFFKFSGSHNERDYLSNHDYNRLLVAFFAEPYRIEAAGLPGTSGPLN